MAIYLGLWLAAFAVAMVMLMKWPGRFSLLSEGYRRLLFQPWKLATFAVAATGMTVIAPWTGDPTWDYFDALLMSSLTFATAPWATGVLYRAIRGGESVLAAYVAACLWLFSASWCYDLYLLLRDSVYPITWWANLKASSILYLLAGMMWNLEWRQDGGGRFAFMAADWPEGNPGNSPQMSWRLAWLLLPIMALVAALILPFLWGGWS